MRSKEEANDYRYFPDPDLLPVVLADTFIDEIKTQLPELPDAKRQRFMQQFGLHNDYATQLTAVRELADYYETVVSGLPAEATELAANWVLGDVTAALNKAGLEITVCPVTAGQLTRMLRRILDNTISGKIAKDVFEAMWSGAAGADADAIIEQRGLQQISDPQAIEAVIDQLIADNPAQVEQYRAGKVKVKGFFAGQVMKAFKGKANPQQVNQLLEQKLAG
jgi:aspartyl-tRNA(Asn)/glutamyl-tRNA(Gln) amidotransferase subunit B